MAPKYNLPARSVYTYDTMHRMADNDDIDIVRQSLLPNALHLEHTVSGGPAGNCAMFCEKPLEYRVQRCQQMIDACKAADVAARYRLLAAGSSRITSNAFAGARSRSSARCASSKRDSVSDVGRLNQWRVKRRAVGQAAR